MLKINQYFKMIIPKEKEIRLVKIRLKFRKLGENCLNGTTLFMYGYSKCK